MYETIAVITWPYDSHNPQNKPFSLGIDWEDPGVSASYGFTGARFDAAYDEIEWTTESKYDWIKPPPPALVRLTGDAAREIGVLQAWQAWSKIPVPGERVISSAPYDPYSPKWPRYPDGSEQQGRETKNSTSCLSQGDTAGA